MQTYSSNEGKRSARRDGTAEDWVEFAPALDNREIFRELIKEELRNGRLSAAGRRRIVRYAANLRMSAVEAGQLIARCGEEALKSHDPVERFHALRLVRPEPSRVPIALKISIVVALAILADLLILGWPW
ncbi:MAG: hypothetical protein ACYTFA_13845 [Planctomycetota bacterium]|jgi:hypothetical protein